LGSRSVLASTGFSGGLTSVALQHFVATVSTAAGAYILVGPGALVALGIGALLISTQVGGSGVLEPIGT
jgi:hypothetical protein